MPIVLCKRKSTDQIGTEIDKICIPDVDGLVTQT